MAIDTFTIKFNEYELETILAALDDYRHYDDEGMDPEDLMEISSSCKMHSNRR